jgi:hypothetical protein
VRLRVKRSPMENPPIRWHYRYVINALVNQSIVD